jgi:hypothetical protein
MRRAKEYIEAEKDALRKEAEDIIAQRREREDVKVQLEFLQKNALIKKKKPKKPESK